MPIGSPTPAFTQARFASTSTERRAEPSGLYNGQRFGSVSPSSFAAALALGCAATSTREGTGEYVDDAIVHYLNRLSDVLWLQARDVH